MGMVSETQQLQLTDMALRQYSRLPRRRDWRGVDRTPYAYNLPDIVAGLVRQFSTQILDTGRLGIQDQERLAIFRSMVFDLRDRLLGQWDEWCDFLDLLGDADQRLLDESVVAAIVD